MFIYGPHPNLMTGAQNAPRHNENPHLICPAGLKQCRKNNVLSLSLASIVKSWREGLTLGSTDSSSALGPWEIALIYTGLLVDLKMCKMSRRNH